MNTTLIFCPLAFLSVFYTSVQGHAWSLEAADVGNQPYLDQVALTRSSDGEIYNIYAVRENSSTNVPEIVYGPFRLRGFGPYSMCAIKIWLNTNGGEKYVTVTFKSVDTAREFYHFLNPHHWPSFPSEIKIEKLMVHSPDGKLTTTFEEDKPKALDIFVLHTAKGFDSKARRLVVHDVDDNQRPILIFHSSEITVATVGTNAILVTVSPQGCLAKYPYTLVFKDASTVEYLMEAYLAQSSLPLNHDLRELEALPRNIYPSRGNALTFSLRR